MVRSLTCSDIADYKGDTHLQTLRWIRTVFGLQIWILSNIHVFTLEVQARDNFSGNMMMPFGFLLLFCIGFNVPFNTFQVIPGRCLLVTEGMITT